jgi:dolichol-phosphate mannosyltransferase
MISVSLIIPTYNEAKNVPLLVEELFRMIDRNRIDLEVIFVDDNSPDGTGQVAEDLASQYPIRVVHRAGKLGLGSAVIAGFKASDRPYLGVMDADLSHDAVILNDLISALSEYDLAMGSRFEESSTVEKWVWWRKLLSHAGVALTRALTGVRDPLSGYFFFRRSVIEGISLTTTGYKILLEILVKGKIAKVKEFSYNFRIRKFSTSKLEAKEYWLFLKQIVGYSWYRLLKK